MVKNMFFLNRRLNRSEYAKRVSHMSEHGFLRNFARDWYFDKDTSLNIYGNLHRTFGLDVYGLRHMYATRGDPHVIL